MTAETIAKAPGGRKAGGGWTARCPFHDDHEPSLSICDADGGKVLVHCHAGCEQEQVIATLRSRGLWAESGRRVITRLAPAGIGRFDDGRLAEVFFTAAKTGTAVEVAARDAAIVASLALQYGLPLKTLKHVLMRNGDGSPSSPLGRLVDLLASNIEGLQL